MDPLKKLNSFNPTKHAFTMLDEFKSFEDRGNYFKNLVESHWPHQDPPE